MHPWLTGKECDSPKKFLASPFTECSKEELAKAIEKVVRKSRVVLSLKLKKKSNNNTNLAIGDSSKTNQSPTLSVSEKDDEGF